VRARYISETIVSSISAVKSVLDIPKDLIKVGFKRNLMRPKLKNYLIAGNSQAELLDTRQWMHRMRIVQATLRCINVAPLQGLRQRRVR